MEDLLNKEVVQVFPHVEECPCVPNAKWHLRWLCSRYDDVEQKWVWLCED